ncbi:hypothetical protein [Streptomyces sp. HUAS TT20]|uniref:hypothetical protein n=1 Tax=Streptomyces sp. HUAS TT20 TaxID=3447509 RepID=UPI0021DB6DEA|nr:hypothetical protein [Streptomyces sp. HUAS 15-9]UXY25217.1 hypothetical protein N8I87_00595 [Streptomyces sp. HUAS 15-9]
MPLKRAGALTAACTAALLAAAGTASADGSKNSMLAVTQHSATGHTTTAAAPLRPGVRVDVTADVQIFGFSAGTERLTVDSEAFTEPVKLTEGKSDAHGTGQIRCGLTPGTYAVVLKGPGVTADDVKNGWRTSVHVTAADSHDCAHDKQQAAQNSHRDGGSSTAVLAGGTAAGLAAVAIGLVALRRRRNAR